MKNELGLFEKTNKILVSSRDVAERFEKRHDNIVTAIEGLIEDSKGYPFQKEAPMFIKQSYIHEQNKQEYVEYLLNKRAFVLLMMRLKGEVAFDMQNKYIDCFEQMEALLRERQTTDWQKTRKHGKLVRREETDAIQLLIPYAEEQGSKNALMLHVNYSKLVNKIVGVEAGQRELLSHKNLMLIVILEDMITRTILEEMERGTFYKNIYKLCKDKAEQFAKLAYIQAV